MQGLSSDIKESIAFEPLIADVLTHVNNQHVRILTMMFKLGGYTTLNVLTEKLAIAQPTVSNRVAELEEMGYLRKNSEMKPKALVLLLGAADLEILLKKRIEARHNAAGFLQELSGIRNIKLLEATFLQAMDTLYPGDNRMARMIAFTYLYQLLPVKKLIKLVSSTNGDVKKLSREIGVVIDTHPEIFQVIYQKHQKASTFIQPRLPLDLFVKSRLVILEAIHVHYEILLGHLKQLMVANYDSIIPHQLLQGIPEIKRRIDTCLKYYKTVRIIDNSIYRKRVDAEGIIELLIASENFEDTHEIMILSNHAVEVPESVKPSQIEHRSLKPPINRDYLFRDFVIFDNHGCLVFPSQGESVPYYNIAPQFTKTVLNIFNTYWSDSDAV
ncbi:MAG: hypothetical protein ACFFD4_27255 [Candidatus Odinarchaeota archaeon]